MWYVGCEAEADVQVVQGVCLDLEYRLTWYYCTSCKLSDNGYKPPSLELFSSSVPLPQSHSHSHSPPLHQIPYPYQSHPLYSYRQPPSHPCLVHIVHDLDLDLDLGYAHAQGIVFDQIRYRIHLVPVRARDRGLDLPI